MQSHRRLPFALYRLPGEKKVIAVFQDSDHVKSSRDWSNPGFVFAPYDSSAMPTLFLQPDRLMECEYSGPSYRIESPVLPEDGPQRQEHIERVAKAIRAIQKGPLQKVVLARSLSVKSSGTPLEAFQRILGAYPGAFCYVFYHPSTGVWTGASPELLLSHTDTIAQTVSLAGTLPANGAVPPHWSPKEIWEQQVVTDYICSRLREQGLHPEAHSAAGVRAGALWHLKTPISVQVTAKRREALLQALHPTPAVCGFPLEEAQSYIAAHEGLPRDYYTGFLGPIGLGNKDSAALYVNLRCARLADGTATLFVGGGITGASDPQMEWEETRHKAGTILSVLNYSIRK